jgi:hypothetical protein
MHCALWPTQSRNPLRRQDQQRKNLRSTKPNKDPDADLTHNSDSSNERFRHAFATTIYEPSGKIATGLAGRFSTTSSRAGNKYILILYDYDSNDILAKNHEQRPGQLRTLTSVQRVIHTSILGRTRIQTTDRSWNFLDRPGSTIHKVNLVVGLKVYEEVKISSGCQQEST